MNMNELGQLFMTGVSGLTLTDEEREFLEQNNIGGVIFFKHNYESPAQLAELVNDIQSCRSELPLFISVDQEGGRVIRFQDHFTQFPSMYEVGKKDSPKLTFEVHQALGEELAACGVNLDFSPCCDVWSNPQNKVIGDRAFGKTAIEVEKHISAAIRGLHQSKVLACAKHFPGHGNTLKDSHVDLPFVKESLENLKENEFLPFRKASRSRVEFMMMAHLMVDAIDSQNPCSLSAKAYKLLRDELKYTEIIVTDDMVMKAISDRYSYEEAATKALEAGADILLYRSLETAKTAFNGVKQAIKEQKMKKDLIEEKLKRIYRCKEKHFAQYKPVLITDITKSIYPDKNQELLEKIT